MRRSILFVGVSILLIGLILIAIGSVGLRNVRLDPVAVSEYEVWDLSAYLTRGKTYVLYVEYGIEWGASFVLGHLEMPQPVNLTLVSPNGGETKFQAFFYGELPSSPYIGQASLAIVDVKYFNVDYSCLDVDESSSKIRFHIKESGNYTVRVIAEELKWTTGPPEQLIFYEEVPENRDFYILFIEVGGPLLLLGVIFSTWGFKATKKLKVKRKILREKGNLSFSI